MGKRLQCMNAEVELGALSSEQRRHLLEDVCFQLQASAHKDYLKLVLPVKTNK